MVAQAALLVLLALCASAACGLPAGRQCAILSEQYGLSMEWEFPNAAEITIGILAGEPVGRRGWAVVGLYPLNAPTPHSAIRADVIAIGRSDANLCPTIRPDVTCNAERLCLVDGYMPGSEFLTDSVQSLKGFNDSRNIEMWEDGGSFGARFTRLLDTGDITQDWPIDVSSGAGPGTNNRIVQGSAMSIVWACHNALDLRSSCSVDRHLLIPGTPPTGCFGVSRVDFAKPSSCNPEAPKAAGGNFTSPSGDFSMGYEVRDGFLYVEIAAATTGWVAMGITNENGAAHVKTDMYVAWVDAAGRVFVEDSWSESNLAKPSKDEQGDAQAHDGTSEFTGTVADGRVAVKFRRPLDTGDALDVQITDQTYMLQWAYGRDGDLGPDYPTHVARGTARISFYGEASAPSFTLDAGVLLCITVAVVIVLWILIHYLNKLVKKRGRIRHQAELAADAAAQVDPARGRFTTKFSETDRVFALGLAGNNQFTSTVSKQQQMPIFGNRAHHVAPSRFAAAAYGGAFPSAAMQAGNRRQSFYIKAGQAVAYLDNDDDGLDDGTGYGYGTGTSTTADNYDYGDVEMHAVPAEATNAPVIESRILSGHEAKESYGKWGLRWFKFTQYRVPGTHMRVLDCLLALIYIFVNVGCLFAAAPASARSSNGWSIIAWSDGLGSLAGGNALLVVVPATRNSIISWLLGIPFDRLVMYHRWLGRWLFALCLGHMVAVMVVWAATESETSIASELLRPREDGIPARLVGLCAFVFLGFILVTSYEWVRRRKFDVFFWSHFVFVAFYIAVALHHAKMVPFVFAAATWYAFDRAMRFMWGAVPRRGMIAAKENDVVRIRFPHHLLGRYRVGQYVFLNFPTLGFVEWHPFTLSSSPLEPFCEVHVKRLGDHTAKLQALANGFDPVTNHALMGDGHKLWVRVDGPYGKFPLNYKRYPIVCLLGGGIGVTPLIALLKAIYRYNLSVKASKKAKQSSVVRAVYFIWSFPAESFFNWFADVITEIDRSAGRNGKPILNMYLHATRQEASEIVNPMVRTGRPDIERIWGQMTADPAGERVAVFACGPGPLVAAGWDASVACSQSGFSAEGSYGAAAAIGAKQFDFHHEVFDF